MKVAEALALRADLQRRLESSSPRATEQLKQRLLKNARIQEGDKPLNNYKNNSKIKGGKGGGQECPATPASE
jgi:hypothetical protein